MRKPFVVADDFGLGHEHNRVILQLMQQGKVQGTSVMIDGLLSYTEIEILKELQRKGCRIGLHINLTQALHNNETVFPLWRLLLAGVWHLPQTALRSIERQTKRFELLFGFLPDYYDGHQHCHCFPNIAQQVASLPRKQHSWMRVPRPNSWSGFWHNVWAGGFKAMVVMVMALYTERVFRKHNWLVNADFSGFLDLTNPIKVHHHLPRLLRMASKGCVFMTHPGTQNDPEQCINHAPSARSIEAHYLQEQCADIDQMPSPVLKRTLNPFQ